MGLVLQHWEVPAALSLRTEPIIRRQSKAILNGIVTPILEQIGGQIKEFVSNREVRRRLAVLILMIGIRALADEVLAQLHVAVLAGQREHRVAVLVGLVDVEGQAVVAADVHSAEVWYIAHLR